MIYKEEILREKISFNRKLLSIDPSWLADIYSKNLSKELRYCISERLGFLGAKGWIFIKRLIHEQGIQSEFIYASGLCYQSEAKEWLFNQLEDTDKFHLEILQALSCWGGDFPITLLEKTLEDKSQDIRLAGLEILGFKSHQINDELLIQLLKEPMNDFREAIVLKAINLLKRRDSELVCNQLADMVINTSENISKAALIALGSIENDKSKEALLKISNSLVDERTKEIAIKQLNNQYR